MRWLFFDIDGKTSKPWPARFQDFDTLTPEQCVEAVAHTALWGGQIELYLQDETLDPHLHAPLTGLVFEGGVYTGYGLGDARTEELQRRFAEMAGEPLITFDAEEKPVDMDWLVELFRQGLSC